MKRFFKLMATFLSLSLIFISSNTYVLANDTLQQNSYKSKLPEPFSHDVTLYDIEQDILDYIQYNKLDIVYGSEEYIQLLNKFSFNSDDIFDESMIRYYSAYSSVFLANSNITLNLNQTIQDIREKNIHKENTIKSLIPETDSSKSVYSTYNVEGAKKYAANYAMINNYNYPEYGADCTNYASQIIHEGGGLPTTSQWNIWAGPDSLAWMSWVNAGAFCTYWGEVRGHIGRTCSSLSDVNRYANPGDFIVWRNKDTLEFFHTQFVQSKINGEIFCSQHSPHYYNNKLNDKYTESSFRGNIIYQLDFT